MYRDNASADTSLKTAQLLIKTTWQLSNSPPHSPDIAYCAFGLFLEVKLKMKVGRFDTIEGIKKEMETVLDGLKEMDFIDPFEERKRH